MKKMFVERKKMTKKKQKELNARDRGTWGNVNPVTRVTKNAKAYSRQAYKKDGREMIEWK